MATPAGFEPAISTVTGWHVRPLHHGATCTHSAEGYAQPSCCFLKSIRGTITCQGEAADEPAIVVRFSLWYNCLSFFEEADGNQKKGNSKN